MPEHTQSAIIELSCGIGFHSLVDTEVLVVPSKYLCNMPATVVIKNEILEQVDEVFLLADTAKHGFQSHTALFFF